MPVEEDYFQVIRPCNTAEETGCFVTWRAYLKENFPKYHKSGLKIVVTNPLSWSIDSTYVPKEQNLGGVLLKYEEIIPAVADAQVHDGFLWLSKPKFPGSLFWRTPNYHAGDYNLFYLNVRYNAVERVSAFLSR